MIERLEAWARSAPSKTALIDEEAGRRYAYGELAALARRTLGGLLASGARPGDRVAALAHNGAELVALLFACVEGGFTLAPLNWRLSDRELAEVLADLAPRWLVADEASLERAYELEPGRTKPLEALPARAAQARAEVPRDPEETPLLLYTSGTTGRPKGAMLSTRMLLANVRQTAQGWGLTADDRTISAAPFFHTGGWNVLTLPLLLSGGEVTLLRKFDAARVARLSREGRASVLFGVPTMFSSLIEEGLERGGRPRFVISGGAPCPRPLLEAYLELGVTFLQGFGMTEVGPNCFQFPASEARRKAGTVGKPMPGTEARLVDGELFLRGPHVFSGYLGRPAESAATLQDGWVRTGDLAARDDEGFYTILGRRKEMYISGGENVYPAEVEAVLHAHPAVLEAAVVGVPDQRWGEAGLAVVVRRPGAGLAVEDLRAFLNARLARYKHPRDIRFAAELPRNAMGKIQKPALVNSLSRGAGVDYASVDPVVRRQSVEG